MRAVVGDYLSDITESVQKRAFNILYPDSSYIQALSKYGWFWYITRPAFVVIKALLTKRPIQGRLSNTQDSTTTPGFSVQHFLLVLLLFF